MSEMGMFQPQNDRPHDLKAIREMTPVGRMSEKARKLLEESAPRPQDFSDMYAPENITRDQAYVKERQRLFEKKQDAFEEEQKMYSDVFEALVIQHGELSDWLGEGAYTVKASHFDDIANGIDLIVSFPGNDAAPERLHLAIDVTFSRTGVPQKITRSYDNLMEGTFSRVKYFACEDTGEKGSLEVPRVVLGIDRDHVAELARLWEGKKNQELGRHEVQLYFLREIEEQLKYFLRGAKRENQTVVIDKLNPLLETIRGIRSQKSGSQGMKSFLDGQDGVRSAILQECQLKSE